MDVNAIDTTGVDSEAIATVQQTAAENAKRVVHFDGGSGGWRLRIESVSWRSRPPETDR